MKIVVVGCTHAGTSAVVNLKELHPESDITIYEKNDNISFLSCGIALNVGKVIKDTKSLFYNSPENLSKLGVVTNMKHEVLDIDFENKTLRVKNLITEEIFEDNYDKLVLTLGSWPIVPKFEGGELENIVLCKNHDHALNIIEKSKDAKNVVIIGAGYIGVELVEAFEMQGKNVTLIDAEKRIMAKYLDKDFTDVAEKEFTDRGVKLVLGEKVQKFNGENGKVTEVVTENGTYQGDLVVLCIGFAPNTKLVQGKIDTLPNGYDTYIEQGGTNVSGGQKQRLCIARALLKKPKILILDDSTSAVDTATDAKIRTAFSKEIPNTTKIIIAQRISSVQDADKIIVLDDGKISGIGTHEELLENNEIYADVYNSQMKGDDDEYEVAK